MTKLRVIIFLSTLLVVGAVGTFVAFYARGYRFSFKTFKFLPNGILVVKSEPDGASVYINGDLSAATNANLPLPPGTYDIEVKREGFSSWYKRLTIEKEIVTQIEASLFKTAPSLSPITFSGAEGPVQSENGGKIAYIGSEGLWVIDVTTLPLGFGREPRRITDGNLSGSTFQFSPNGNEILLTTSQGIFLLQSASFTPQPQRINVASRKSAIISGWEEEKKVKMTSVIKNLPGEISELFLQKTSLLTPSPDEQMILYIASASATLPKGLVSPLPGASTQKQERSIKDGQTYMYDIKEDRNFSISGYDIKPRWLPTSRHLLLAEEGKVTIMDYDGTNRQEVYKGAYVSPFAYPLSNSSKILILTNLGSDSSPPNLYSLTIK